MFTSPKHTHFIPFEEVRRALQDAGGGDGAEPVFVPHQHPERRFPCQEPGCEFAARSRHLLSRHLSTHLGRRPHVCPICERAFRAAVTLRNHVNAHTGLRPVKCRLCPDRFNTAGERKRHENFEISTKVNFPVPRFSQI